MEDMHTDVRVSAVKIRRTRSRQLMVMSDFLQSFVAKMNVYSG